MYGGGGGGSGRNLSAKSWDSNMKVPSNSKRHIDSHHSRSAGNRGWRASHLEI